MATATIADACPALAELIAVDAPTYIARAEDQIDCTVATAHESTAPLDPQCGPSNVDAMPPRGEWTQIILDGDKWGTMCGDGTEYAINVKLAPDGSPADRVLIGLEGGGVCLFEEDCRARLSSNPQLFNAQDGLPLGTGFRPDELISLFGGFSAGGYGALYNYHWMLDDLQWPRTAAYPDAGGALDNGNPLLGVRGVGVAGERMVDWFWRAVTDPDSITDRAEEGEFTTNIPGSSPFPCELPL